MLVFKSNVGTCDVNALLKNTIKRRIKQRLRNIIIGGESLIAGE